MTNRTNRESEAVNPPASSRQNTRQRDNYDNSFPGAIQHQFDLIGESYHRTYHVPSGRHITISNTFSSKYQSHLLLALHRLTRTRTLIPHQKAATQLNTLLFHPLFKLPDFEVDFSSVVFRSVNSLNPQH
ncbi:hypothetical protein BLNAU_14298 [Blattamonas nauphoetae]|uniref:Uncharacterized protein n=1 Tax=Blattamonas nauphoetae TaxID=2049346 RepID=A0ABQ9XIZ0_9EUKA|nr:hypothetical protein BLNAU_14298 [Blattamonas nauphoetae]